MMSLTHVTTGIAASLLVSLVKAPIDLVVTVAGGVVGGVLADFDLLSNNVVRQRKNKVRKNATAGTSFAVLSIFFTAVLDALSGGTVWQYITSNIISTLFGIAILILLLYFSYRSDHRGFTHSILALVLFSIAFFAIYPSLGIACFLAYSTHLLLDLLNMEGIQLFFPIAPRLSLKLCRSDGKTNNIFMYVGLVTSILFLLVRIIALNI